MIHVLPSGYEPGSRVGVLNASMTKFLGWGTYDGDMPPPKEYVDEVTMLTLQMYDDGQLTDLKGEDERKVTPRDEFERWMREYNTEFKKLPRITLDDGRHVYGYQCWWGPPARIRAVAKKNGVEVPPDPKEEKADADV